MINEIEIEFQMQIASWLGLEAAKNSTCQPARKFRPPAPTIGQRRRQAQTRACEIMRATFGGARADLGGATKAKIFCPLLVAT